MHLKLRITSLILSLCPLLHTIGNAQSLPVPDLSASEKEEIKVKNPSASDLLLSVPQGGIDSYSGERKLTFSDLNKDRYRNSKITENDLKAFDELIVNNKFDQLITVLKKTPDDPRLLDWLDARAKQGYILVMWHIAERFSYSDPLRSIYWGQTALIGTRQEARLCVHQDSAKNASISMVTRFPKAGRASSANNWRVKEAIDFGLELYKNHPNLPSPALWLCKPLAHDWFDKLPKKNRPKESKELNFLNQGIYTYDPKYFNELRRRERNAIRKQLNYPDTSFEATPKEFLR